MKLLDDLREAKAGGMLLLRVLRTWERIASALERLAALEESREHQRRRSDPSAFYPRLPTPAELEAQERGEDPGAEEEARAGEALGWEVLSQSDAEFAELEKAEADGRMRGQEQQPRKRGRG